MSGTTGQRLATQAAPLEAPVLRARSGGGTIVTEAGAPASVTMVVGFAAASDDLDRATLHVSWIRYSPPSPARPAASHPWRRSYKEG